MGSHGVPLATHGGQSRIDIDNDIDRSRYDDDNDDERSAERSVSGAVKLNTEIPVIFMSAGFGELVGNAEYIKQLCDFAKSEPDPLEALRLIGEAARYTAESNPKQPPRYLSSILKKWSNAGLHTLEAVRQAEHDRAQRLKAEKAKATATPMITRPSEQAEESAGVYSADLKDCIADIMNRPRREAKPDT